jgi:F-type H+-transporting ATPase subunit delta
MSQTPIIALEQEVEYLQEHVNIVTSQIFRSEQLDILQLSLINLMDMVKDQEIDLVLSQAGKSSLQKKLFIEKIVSSVRSRELRTLLETAVKQNHLEFFQERYLGSFLHKLRTWAEQFKVVKLELAIDFDDSDLRKMAMLLTEKIGCPVVLDIKVDKNLIGGTIVQFGSFISDYSLKTQLDLVKTNWKKAVLDNQPTSPKPPVNQSTPKG